MYLGLFLGSLFSTNIFVISCTFSAMSFCVSCNFSTYKMSQRWVKLVLPSLIILFIVVLAIFIPLLFQASFLSFCQILKKNPAAVWIGIIIASGKGTYVVSFTPVFFYVPQIIRIGWTMLQE